MQSRRKHRGTLYAAVAAVVLAGGAAAPGARAEEPEPPGTVGLDQLLRLPPPSRAQAGETNARPGGASAAEWRTRFAEARADIEEAKQALAAAQDKLGELSEGSGQWQMNAPGIGGAANTKAGGNSPVSFQLHQEIKRQREEIEHAEHRLQEVKVEAALAGVPEEWTRPPGATAADPAGGTTQP